MLSIKNTQTNDSQQNTLKQMIVNSKQSTNTKSLLQFGIIIIIMLIIMLMITVN